MRGYTRVIHPNACLNSVFNAFRNDEVVVRLIIAGGEGRGEDNALNARRETRRKKLRRSHVEIPSDAPRPPTHFELVLEMVEHDPINGASAMLPMFQINGETYETAIKDAPNLCDAYAVRNPVIHQRIGERDLIPAAPTKNATSAGCAVGNGMHSRRKGGGPPQIIRTPDLSRDEPLQKARLLQQDDVRRILLTQQA